MSVPEILGLSLSPLSTLLPPQSLSLHTPIQSHNLAEHNALPIRLSTSTIPLNCPPATPQSRQTPAALPAFYDHINLAQDRSAYRLFLPRTEAQLEHTAQPSSLRIAVKTQARVLCIGSDDSWAARSRRVRCGLEPTGRTTVTSRLGRVEDRTLKVYEFSLSFLRLSSSLATQFHIIIPLFLFLSLLLFVSQRALRIPSSSFDLFPSFLSIFLTLLRSSHLALSGSFVPVVEYVPTLQVGVSKLQIETLVRWVPMGRTGIP